MDPGYREGAREILPLVIPLIGFGVAFGVLAREAGMGVVAPVLMSATTFAGSAQFAAASILGVGGSAAAAIAAALLLKLALHADRPHRGRGHRGAALAPLPPLPAHRGRVLGRRHQARRGGRQTAHRAGLVLYATWVASTFAGVLSARALGDPERLGLDAAFPAVFVALLVPQLRGTRARVAAALGAGIALLLLPWAPAGVPVIAATAAVLVGWAR